MSIEEAIVLVLSTPLLAKAKILAGELAWSADDALEVINSLSASHFSVVGVELWQEHQGSPKWIATSDYNHSEDGDNKQYVELCAQSAKQFVLRFQHEPDALFNLI